MDIDITKNNKKTTITFYFVGGTESKYEGTKLYIPEGLAVAKYISAVTAIEREIGIKGINCNKLSISFREHWTGGGIIPPDYFQRLQFYHRKNKRKHLIADSHIRYTRYSERSDDGRVGIDISKQITPLPGLDDLVIAAVNKTSLPITGDFLTQLAHIGFLEHPEGPKMPIPQGKL